MKSFEEWTRERREAGHKIALINGVIFVLSLLAYSAAAYLKFPAPAILWIYLTMLALQTVLSVAQSIIQQRKFTAESRAEKLEMEQRFAREDAELNATILMPHNAKVR